MFDQIIYFGEPEPKLQSLKTHFIPCQSKPTIRAMAKTASDYGSWTCIVNADIVVTDKFGEVERRLKQLECECALSGRYDIGTGMVLDQGLDIFCALPKVWRNVSLRIPKTFTLGRILWDTWTLSYFVKNYGRKCADFTPSKCVFHPHHGERVDQNIEPVDDPYLKNYFWPTTTIY